MAKDIYEDFLRLTGFEEAEIPVYLPEWRESSEQLGLTRDDIEFATKEWIPTHFEVALEGVRKVLGCHIKETIDLTNANEFQRKGGKIVYGIMPAIPLLYFALRQVAPDKVYVGFPDFFLATIMNGFFHKLDPYLEEAERGGMSYGCSHCALNKTRYALRRLGIIPSPDVSWLWGFVCDEAPKTDELINLYYDPDWKTYVTRVPHDQPFGSFEDENDERVEYLAAQIKDGFEFVQRETGVKVTNEQINEVIALWRRYSEKVAAMNTLMAADPQPLGGIEGYLFAHPLTLPFNTGLEGMENAIDIIIKELKERVDKKQGILPEGAPKMMTHIMPTALPWIITMFKENGVGVPFSQTAMPTEKQLAVPRFEDPYLAVAEKWLQRTSSVNVGYKFEIYRQKIERYGIEGVIFGFFDFDRWIGSDQRFLAKLLEEETHLPVFYVEGNIWEDRDYSQEALRTRIESICEILKMRRA